MNQFDPLIWSALLTVLGCALIVLEVFIPSGGVLGFLAATAVFSAIMLAFYHHGPAVGFMFVAIGVVALPAALAEKKGTSDFGGHQPAGRPGISLMSPFFRVFRVLSYG